VEKIAASSGRGSRVPADEINRYSRHFVIPEVGEKGQAKLLDSKVLLLGAGALRVAVALYLAAAGVGNDRAGGFRRGRSLQPAAADNSHHRPGWGC